MNSGTIAGRTAVVAVMMTCFNRRETTLGCLRRLALQKLPDGHRIEVFLVDDGSHDGTGDAVRREFSSVRVLQGTGSLYWCGGMRLAWQEAAKVDPEYYLALNDDTMIVEHAVKELLALVGSPEDRKLAVAAIADGETGEALYGGVSWKMRMVPPAPSGEPACCASVCGNCLLIPRAVYRELGMFYPYTHGLADYDYGFTATRRGIAVLQGGTFLGTCSANMKTATWEDPTLPRCERLRKMMAPTGLPIRDHLIYSIRIYRWTWPRRVIGPFLRILLGF